MYQGGAGVCVQAELLPVLTRLGYEVEEAQDAVLACVRELRDCTRDDALDEDVKHKWGPVFLLHNPNNGFPTIHVLLVLLGYH